MPKTSSYLLHKSIPRSLSVCQTESCDNYISVECSCIPCRFLLFEQNEFETFFNAEMIMC